VSDSDRSDLPDPSTPSTPSNPSTPEDRPRWLRLEPEHVTLPDGREIVLDVVRHPGASAIVPMLDDDTVLMIRQYRHATGGTILEIPAGKLDPGEDPRTCAARELEEETGYRAGRLEALTTIWTTPGFTDEQIHLFLARDLRPGEQQLEHDELIELVPMPFAEALERTYAGEISDGKTALGLLHADHRMRSGS